MLRKDFLASQIEELARTMTRLLASLPGLTFDDALRNVENTFSQSNLDLQGISDMPKHEIAAIISRNPAFDGNNIEALSDIISALAEKSGDGTLYRKSLFLLEYVNSTEKIFSLSRKAKIDRLKTRC